MSAGDTPEMRAAWPMVVGRIFESFCRASRHKLGTDEKSKVLGNLFVFQVLEFLNFRLLPFDVAGILDGNLNLLDYFPGQSVIAIRQIFVADLRPGEYFCKESLYIIR
jgi:hypothetical protein